MIRSEEAQRAAAVSINLKGIAALQSGDIFSAVASFRSAIATATAVGDFHRNLGAALLIAGQAPEAEIAFMKALTLEPADPANHEALGTTRFGAGRLGMAKPCYRRSLSLDADRRVASINLAFTLHADLRLHEAFRVLRRTLAIRPADEYGWNMLGLCKMALGEPKRSAISLRRSLISAPTPLPSPHSNLLLSLSYDGDVGNGALFREYRRWEAAHAARLYGRIGRHANAPDPDRRLKVGYLSADLRAHPIAQLLEGLWAAHDRDQVEAVAYAEVARPDEVSERLRGTVLLWRSTVGVPDEAVVEMIRADGIDVLVCVGGHTGGNRVLVCAPKPAPVQVNFHDVSTSGLRAMDWWLTDGWVHPEESTEGRTERLLRIPSLYLHRPPASAPAIDAPSSLGDGVVRFGSFNNPAKIGDEVLRLWARIVLSTPGSRLVLGYLEAYDDPLVSSRVLGRLAAYGLGAERVEVAGAAAGKAEHLARVGRIDVGLDPFPFNGGITTFEALWMGVPVVTLAGQRFAARGGVAHLGPLGLGELIAKTEDEYVRIAADLGGSLARRSAFRHSLRPRVAGSSLCDAAAYARTVEAAFRHAWRDWCTSQR